MISDTARFQTPLQHAPESDMQEPTRRFLGKYRQSPSVTDVKELPGQLGTLVFDYQIPLPVPCHRLQ
jgi:hypothetical protein